MAHHVPHDGLAPRRTYADQGEHVFRFRFYAGPAASLAPERLERDAASQPATPDRRPHPRHASAPRLMQMGGNGRTFESCRLTRMSAPPGTAFNTRASPSTRAEHIHRAVGARLVARAHRRGAEEDAEAAAHGPVRSVLLGVSRRQLVFRLLHCARWLLRCHLPLQLPAAARVGPGVGPGIPSPSLRVAPAPVPARISGSAVQRDLAGVNGVAAAEVVPMAPAFASETPRQTSHRRLSADRISVRLTRVHLTWIERVELGVSGRWPTRSLRLPPPRAR